MSLAEEIAAEADRIRHDGSLPADYERLIRETFAELASYPAALQAEVERKEAERRLPDVTNGVMGIRGLPLRAARAGTRLAWAAGRRTRRHFGPQLRAAERHSVEVAALAVQWGSTHAQVAADALRRRTAGSTPARAVARVLSVSSEAGAQTRAMPPALRFDAQGRLEAPDLERVIVEQLTASPVLHTEAGDGRLVERLRRAGLDAEGADPVSDFGERLGAVEALWKRHHSSLRSVVLSGVTDRLTPARARALVRLVVTRLAPGGTLVVLSAAPAAVEAADPVGADIGAGRPLHSVTWAHLLTRSGFEEVKVVESSDGTAYALSARRSEH